MPDVSISVPRRPGAAWMLLPPSRFSRAPAWLSGLVLAVLAALILYGAMPGPRAGVASGPVAAADGDDIALYDAIARRVAAGEPYHTAAVEAHRLAGYPLHPFVTVRLPTLAYVEAALGPGARVLLWGLALAAWLATSRRLRIDLGPGRPAAYAAALAALSLPPALAPTSAHWHEPWAAILMALSLATRSRRHWAGSVLLGLAAASFRELAAPYLAVMAVAALWERRRLEAAAWGVASLVFAALMAAHAHLLAALVVAGDLRSPGWSGLGGWRFVLQMVQHFTGLALLAPTFVAVATPLALLGWAAWPGPFGVRGALLTFGYVEAFMVVGQPYNVYWGMMLAPLLPLGLVFAPSALRDLVASVAGCAAGNSLPLPAEGSR